MQTERLYFQDPTLTAFQARVIRLESRPGGVRIALDRSAFYPEGGGQPADHGTLAGLPVLDVQRDGDLLWHHLAEPLAEGTSVEGVVDWPRRLDHMQQHHGQHLLSAALDNSFGFRTVSFHLGADGATIDLQTAAVTPAQLREAETLANRVIWEARPIHARFVTPEELATIPLRKAPAVEGPVRIVSVPDFDHSACGGTHPATTGGVGALAIRRTERRGAETRIEFVCGGRVLRDLHARSGIAQRSALALSVGLEELEDAVLRLVESEKAARSKADALTAEAIGRDAERRVAEAPRVGTTPVVEGLLGQRGLDEARLLAQRIAALGGVAILGVEAGGKHQLIVARGEDRPVDAGKVVREAVTAFGGRGGGQAGLAQGGVPDSGALAEAVAAAGRLVATTLRGET